MKINPILRRNTYMLSWETFFFVGEMRNELNKIKVNADLTLFFLVSENSIKWVKMYVKMCTTVADFRHTLLTTHHLTLYLCVYVACQAK